LDYKVLENYLLINKNKPLFQNTHANTNIDIANIAPNIVQKQSVTFLSFYLTGNCSGSTTD